MKNLSWRILKIENRWAGTSVKGLPVILDSHSLMSKVTDSEENVLILQNGLAFSHWWNTYFDNFAVFWGWIIMASNHCCIQSPSPHFHTNKPAVVSSFHTFEWADNGRALLVARRFWLFSRIAGIMRDFFSFFDVLFSWHFGSCD